MVIVMNAIATTYVQTYSAPGIYAVTIPMNYGVIIHRVGIQVAVELQFYMLYSNFARPLS